MRPSKTETKLRSQFVSVACIGFKKQWLAVSLIVVFFKFQTLFEANGKLESFSSQSGKIFSVCLL